MKKYLLFSIPITILLSFAYFANNSLIPEVKEAWSGGVKMATVSISGTGEPQPKLWFKLEAAGGSGSAQIYDEISSSWMGGNADSGVTFTTGCIDTNGASYDANTEYITLANTDITGAGITNWNEGTIRFVYKWNGTTAGSTMYRGYTSDGMYLLWNAALGTNLKQFELRVYEAGTIEAAEDWVDNTLESNPNTCYCYEINWDISVPSATLYRTTISGGSCDWGSKSLVTATGTMSGYNSETDTVSPQTTYLGNWDNSDSRHGHGILDEIKWYYPSLE